MIIIPQDLYEIYVYNHDKELVTVLQKWDRLEFTQRVNDPWNLTIELHLNTADNTASILRSFKRDYFIDIYRTDPILGRRDRVFEGFHHTLSEQMTSTGDLYFGLYGGGYAKLLERRVVFPTPGEENNKKTGKAETLIKQYLTDCMIKPHSYAGSLYENGVVYNISIDGNDRIFPGFSVAADLERGVETEYTARFTNLESVIKNLVENGGLYYGVDRGTELGEFVFDCRPIWGKDRRVDNTAGNTPAVFSVENGNIVLPLFSENHRYEKNVILVGGSGEGEQRRIIVTTDAESVLESPWGWSELFVDSRKLDTIAGLQTVGLATIYERSAQKSLEFQVLQTRQSRWLHSWGVGDFVTAFYAGKRFDKVIVEVNIDVSASNEPENMTIQMEDIPPVTVLAMADLPEIVS